MSDYPMSPEFAAVNFRGMYSNIKSETRSGRVQVRNIGGQKWSFSAKYSLLTRKQMGPVMAFVSQQEGILKSFSIVLPEFSYTAGGATGAANVQAAASAGSESCSISMSGMLLQGDLIKFAQHDKVYMVTGSGNGSISFTPALSSSVNANESIIYNGVPFRVRLSNDVQTFKVKGNDMWSYDVDMEEDII